MFEEINNVNSKLPRLKNKVVQGGNFRRFIYLEGCLYWVLLYGYNSTCTLIGC